ncbi:MAG TPA: aldehyde dehydrogenase family protein [Polyangiaceae bacterium]|nr:aldehyde dehydrogenase family protein [Polyangiaceae bacterium]
MNDQSRTRELPALGADFPKPEPSGRDAPTARDAPRPEGAPAGAGAPREGSATREAPRAEAAVTAVHAQPRDTTLVAARHSTPPAPRLRVQKTYKLFVGGQFIRSESGRYTALADQGGESPGATENVPRASRKDARDAVRVALGAQPGWAARTAFNRAQIVYRLAEVMEGRMGELTWELARASASPPDVARREVALAIDHVVSAAGWCDKFQPLLGAENPAAGPFLNVSFAEPMGVVAVVAPPFPSLLGLVDALLPPLVAGNASVVLVSERDPRTALTFGECLATSDLPGGVVNLLAGDVAEVAPHLAKHQDVHAFSLWTEDDDLARALEEAAAGSVKRVRRYLPRPADAARPLGLFDVEAFCETKTVWHPAAP